MRLRQLLYEAKANPQAPMEQLIEERLHILEEKRDEIGWAEAWYTLGLFRYWLGNMAGAEEALERCLVFAEVQGLTRVRAEALARLGWVMENGPIRVNQALQRLQEIQRRSRGQRFAEADLLTARAHLEAMVGRFDTSGAIYQ
jgi:tetratricopeptide (TPR) repeat protein